jgi:membrane fusion protein, multidrug efflux system
LWPVRESTPSLFVPSGAIVQTATRTFVDVVTNGRIRQVGVQPGRSMGDVVQIFGMLKAGDEVVANPSPEMTDGAPVTPVRIKLQGES